MKVTVITFEIECKKGHFRIQFQRVKAYQYTVLVLDMKIEKVIYKEVHSHIHTVAASSAKAVLGFILEELKY